MFPEINDRNKCKLKAGDKVRVAIYKDIFKKGYTANWSEEIYTIDRLSMIVFFKKVQYVGIKSRIYLGLFIPNQNIFTT